MYILRIEHPVPDYDGWKKAFDSDPVGEEVWGPPLAGLTTSGRSKLRHDGP